MCSKTESDDESEITPEMVRVGAEVIWRLCEDSMPYGSTWGEEVARSVYRAMKLVSDCEEPSKRDERMRQVLQMIPYEI